MGHRYAVLLDPGEKPGNLDGLPLALDGCGFTWLQLMMVWSRRGRPPSWRPPTLYILCFPHPLLKAQFTWCFAGAQTAGPGE